MRELKPNTQRANYAIYSIWSIFILSAFLFILEMLDLYLVFSIENGESFSELFITIFDITMRVTGGLLVVSVISSIVLFIYWFRRAYYNLSTKYNDLLYSNGWAAGAWFIPIINLYLPYQIMKELYEKTDQYLTFVKGDTYESKLNTNNVVVWWILWIVSGYIGNIVLKLMINNSFFDSMDSSIISLFENLLDIALCVITIFVIKDYSEAEKLLMEVNLNEDDTILNSLE